MAEMNTEPDRSQKFGGKPVLKLDLNS